MEGISNSFSFETKQSGAELFQTQTKVDMVNKGLKQNGKETVKTMGKDEFLKLLITQLQHQDPTNPMEDREFIAQMAQFSSLEQMLNINTNMEKFLGNMSFSSSFDLLGKIVDVESADKFDEEGTAKILQGVVESVSKNGNNTMVRINGTEYPVEGIIRVRE